MKPLGNIDPSALGLRPGDVVLDLGCSAGSQTVPLAQRGLRVTGLDISPKLALQCLERARGEDVQLNVVIADAGELPFPDGAFDAVVSTEVFEHLPNPAAAAREVFRVLRVGGRACIAVPTERSERLFRRLNSHWVEDSGHVQLFAEHELQNVLLAAGFAVEWSRYTNVEWTLFWIVHSLAGSRFDFTGTPIGRTWLTRAFFKVWHGILRTPFAGPITRTGNRLLPKSVYVYARKD